MRAYIVENSEIIRVRLALLLAEIEGLELAGQAGNVRVATREIVSLQPDVALVDIKLSDGNGLDLLESIQAQGLKTKLIVMTFDPYSQYRNRAMKLGVIHFIDKAKGFENIRSILMQMIAEQFMAIKVT